MNELIVRSKRFSTYQILEIDYNDETLMDSDSKRPKFSDEDNISFEEFNAEDIS